MTADQVTTAVVAWADRGGRSVIIAEALGAPAHTVVAGQRGHLALVPIRYLRQAVRTARLLRASRPDVVIVQNPPIVAVAVVWLVQRLGGGELVIDSHTGAFVDRRWRRFLFMHRWLSRRARTTIVHNEDQAQIVAEWGVPWLELAYIPFSIPTDETVPARPRSVLVVCSGAEDEPFEAIVGAARALSDVDFVITGREERLRRYLVGDLPTNVRILGFVPFDEYLTMVRSSTVVVALTTRDGTLVSGGFEAMAARRPLVTSDSRVLRHFFAGGTIHTENSATSIEAAVSAALDNAETLAEEMRRFALHSEAAWVHAREVILAPRGASTGRR